MSSEILGAPIVLLEGLLGKCLHGKFVKFEVLVLNCNCELNPST